MARYIPSNLREYRGLPELSADDARELYQRAYIATLRAGIHVLAGRDLARAIERAVRQEVANAFRRGMEVVR